jgi:predicted anti-sigma-YlaC factor YlaD
MKHSCDKALSLAGRYIDGEMVWLRRVRVEWHLHRCQHCDDGFLFERQLKQRVHDGCHEEIPIVVYERLRAVLREYSRGEDPAR